MAKIRDLTQGTLGQAARQAHRDRYATPMNGASIGRGGLRVYGGGVITIENGGLKVTGTAEIIGRLIASGIIDFTGDVTVSGPMDVSGILTVTNNLIIASGGKITAGSIELNPDGSAKFGSLTISPAGKITSGSAEINPDGSVKFGALTIDTAGKVTAGGVSLDPNYFDGSVRFSNGTYLAATPNGAQLVKAGGGAVTVSAAQADMGAGAYAVIVNGNGVSMLGLPTTPNKPNLYMDPVTKVLKVSTAVF
ncbi:hypothetical protein [Arthrobacter sp. UYCu712]|uniref:hypothetical protein n=1 Tax=Arthrobacter sp. UYCu712 TaxID=3156340 RepID=UPI0033952F2E